MERQMGEIIAAYRKEKGMTQRELAKRLNVTDKAVSKWERNLACPDIHTLPKLAETLGITVGELLSTVPEAAPGGDRGEALLDLVLKAVPLAMGIALVVVSVLKKELDVYTLSGFAGIGLFALSLRQIRNN